MNGEGHLDKKYLFDEVVLSYEKRRPNYGLELFEDIIKYAAINRDKSIIEVGCGTGQATEPFLKTKCKVTAVELGENLAAHTRKKYFNYPNLEVIQSAFEDYECEDSTFDMLYSATAFHWIPDEIGYKKAYRIIKNGGTLALFWNRPSVNSKENLLHQKIQSVYNEFLPQWNHKAANNTDKSRYSSIINQIKEYGFTDIEFKLYHNTRKMTGVEYVELLNTYSDHRALDKSIQLPFLNAIRTTIEDFGNELLINDTVDLYLARKH
ncbi:class I SAM-dependent methyltransferase [Anaerosolibacter carboniphilus]|uniref:class I SAM-dependent methyltransferase n=1 Tax=Anaerosolibacter carboniphilus TaxID=1417629 RepID=UPI001A9B722B|nr:class I SAM-dependent methyltransferase [Anaerosolibacter carboniphilus]